MLKNKRAKKVKYLCNLCPRRCGAIRTENENVGGFCGMPYSITAALANLHFWEEPCISGKKGSGTIFFSGCQLKCVYCQNHNISHLGFGKQITPKRLSEIFKELCDKGANNINLVSPTPYVPLIIEALDIYKPPIPIVYNSGGYENTDTLQMLKDYVDIYLLDVKYFDSVKAKKYSLAEDYPCVVKNVVKKAVDLVGKPFLNEDGIMKRGVIIRHLLLPSATKDAIDVIKWVKEEKLPVIFSLMNQYTVMPKVPNMINRKVTDREYNKVLNVMQELEIDGYIQENSSSDIKYIPNFDLSGI